MRFVYIPLQYGPYFYKPPQRGPFQVEGKLFDRTHNEHRQMSCSTFTLRYRGGKKDAIH